MFNVLLAKTLKKRILNKFEMSLVKLTSLKLIIIVFISFKISNIWVDACECVCCYESAAAGAAV